MKIFDSKGMMIIPRPSQKDEKEGPKVLVVKECFCPNGHNLVSKRAMFDEFEGIIMKAKKEDGEGILAISPIYGQKARISMDIELVGGEPLELYCPYCDIALPAFSSCHCGGKIIAFFANRNRDFSNCIGVCNRVDCRNAVLQNEGKLLSLSLISNI